MPLGFEVNNEMPSLIQHGGDYAANQLIETGKTIQAVLLRNQAFRETRSLGEQLSQINPTSDDYPQAAAAIVSQHPLAIQTGLAKMVLEPGMKAYAAAQAAKRTDALIKGRADLHGGGNTPVYIPNGGPRPDVGGSLGQDPLSVTPSPRSGIAGILGNSDQTLGGQIPTAPDNSLLPSESAIPDAASAMRKRARPLQSYIDENSQVFNDALAAKQTPPFTRSQISTIAAKQKMADDKEINSLNASPKVKATLTDAAGNLYRELVDGNFIYPDGTKHVAAPPKLTRVPGANEDRRLTDAEQKFDYRKTRDVQTDAQKTEAAAAKLEQVKQSSQAKALDRQLKTVDTDLSEARKALKTYRDNQIKNTEDENLKQRVFAQEKVVTDLIAKRNAKLGEYTDLLKSAVENGGDERSGPAVKIMKDPDTGKRYEVDPQTKKIIREVQ